MKQSVENHLQIILYKCYDGQGSFITSDTPAFMHISMLEKNNLNSIICPLSPNYLIMICKGEKNSIADVDYRLANNELIRKFNRIILNHSNKAIVSNERYLAYTL